MKRLVVLLVVACAGAPRPVPGPAPQELGVEGPRDPALDCVAAQLTDPPDPARYREVLPLGCGSPLYPIAARVVAAKDARAAVDDMRKLLLSPAAPIAIGTAKRGDRVAIVIATKLVELERTHDGIRGHVLANIDNVAVVTSTAAGIEQKPVELRDGAFEVSLAGLNDADVELAIVDGRELGPMARVRVGHGSPLFAAEGTLLVKANAARAHLGLAPLRGIAGLGSCDGPLPGTIEGVEIAAARCHDVPYSDEHLLAIQATYSPLMQGRLLDGDAALFEIGKRDHAAGFRVLRRFDDKVDRARVLAQLRDRWPGLAAHPAPAGALAKVLGAWSESGKPLAPEPFQPALELIAKSWSPAPRYYAALLTSRELDVALARLAPDTTPVAADAEVVHARGPDGAMYHLIAVIFATP